MQDIEKSAVVEVVRQIEDSPFVRALRAVQESPGMRAIQEIENSPLAQLVRALDSSPTAQAIEAQQRHSERLRKQIEESSFAKVIRDFQDSPLLNNIQELMDSPGIRALETMADRLSTAYGTPTFRNAYEEIVQRYEQAAADGEDLEVVADDVEARATNLPPGPLSAECYLQIVLALFLCYLTHMSTSESEKRIVKRLETMERAIVEQHERMCEHEQGSVFYVVVATSLNLRAGPGIDSDLITVLPHNAKVREKERRPDWIKIEYFDYSANQNVVGWVAAEYLLRLSPEPCE